VIDVGRVDVRVGTQDQSLLEFVERDFFFLAVLYLLIFWIFEEQLFDQFTLYQGFFYNIRNIFRLDLAVERPFRMDDHDGALFAKSMTPGKPHFKFIRQAIFAQFFLERLLHTGCSVSAASGTGAERNQFSADSLFGIQVCAIGLQRFSIRKINHG
jgi:hypothetical protein